MESVVYVVFHEQCTRIFDWLRGSVGIFHPVNLEKWELNSSFGGEFQTFGPCPCNFVGSIPKVLASQVLLLNSCLNQFVGWIPPGFLVEFPILLANLPRAFVMSIPVTAQVTCRRSGATRKDWQICRTGGVENTNPIVLGTSISRLKWH